jgi:hypothetical protein
MENNIENLNRKMFIDCVCVVSRSRKQSKSILYFVKEFMFLTLITCLYLLEKQIIYCFCREKSSFQLLGHEWDLCLNVKIVFVVQLYFLALSQNYYHFNKINFKIVSSLDKSKSNNSL